MEAAATFERLNTSELARGFDMDRAVVRERIRAAGIKPVEEKAKEKIYELTPDLEELLLETNSDLDAAKLRKMTAEAEIKEMDALIKKGEYVSVAVFKDKLNEIFGAMYQEVTVRMPQRISGRLHKAKSLGDVYAILTRELSKVFTDLRTDHPKFLEGPKAVDPAKRPAKLKTTKPAAAKTAEPKSPAAKKENGKGTTKKR